MVKTYDNGLHNKAIRILYLLFLPKLILEMKFRNIVSVIILLTVFTSVNGLKAQYSTDIGGKVGAALFLGDIGNSGAVGIDLNQMRYHLGFGYRYFFSPNFAIRGGFNYGQVRGSDANSEINTHYSRNLSFKNDIMELNARAEGHFLTIRDVGRRYTYRIDFNMFVFAGLGAFYNNPKAKYQGSWVALQPLKTEGVNYSRIQPIVPVGLGFQFRVNKKHLIGWDFGLRKTFTDYIDDVSSRYAHYTQFTDPTALALQDRSIELAGKNDPRFVGSEYYSYGSNPNSTGIRGNPDSKDWYAFTGITYSYSFRGKKRSFSKSKYHFSRRKFKRKRSRAKF